MQERTPLYLKSFDEAYAQGEIDQYRADNDLNQKCAKAVRAALADNFDGYHLQHGASDAVIQEFGLDRTKYVLASTIQLFDYDGRISRDNKAWAKDFTIMDSERDRRYYLIDSPGLLDILTREVRETEVLLNQVADNIIDIGRHGTTSGNYLTSFEEAGKDILPAEKVDFFKQDIIDLMQGSEAVSDVELSDDGCFDVNYYLAYTPNYEPWQEEIDEYGEDWPQQEPLPERSNKPSVLAQLQESKKATEQGTKNRDTAPKHNTEREV